MKNLPLLVDDPYFLTRQTANLMEDFDREVKRGSAMYLLHGVTGVGKTRLLRELDNRRLDEAGRHWIDLADEKDAGDDSRAAAGRIEALFERAARGDLLIVDHVESASRKSRHQLLQSWSTDGIDKQLNLIVAVDSEGFDDLRQLCAQFQVSASSFRMEPLGSAETEAFAGFYLYPSQPMAQLIMPRSVRRQLKRCRGIIARVRDLLDRERGAIGNRPDSGGNSRAAARLLGIALLLMAMLAIGWYWIEPGDAATTPSSTPGGES